MLSTAVPCLGGNNGSSFFNKAKEKDEKRGYDDRQKTQRNNDRSTKENDKHLNTVNVYNAVTSNVLVSHICELS